MFRNATYIADVSKLIAFRDIVERPMSDALGKAFEGVVLVWSVKTADVLGLDSRRQFS